MGPYFPHAVLIGNHCDLEVENATATNFQGRSPPHQAFAEARSWSPDVAMAFGNKIVKEMCGVRTGRRASRQVRLSYDSPEFCDRRKADSPSLAVIQGFLDRGRGGLMFCGSGSVSVDEKICV